MTQTEIQDLITSTVEDCIGESAATLLAKLKTVLFENGVVDLADVNFIVDDSKPDCLSLKIMTEDQVFDVDVTTIE
jgi:hypothetical protein